jgi:predicted Rossmann fold nucleotide-binding protein DprA/Smf involved in DNA uptake
MEYNALASWLGRQERRPADLLRASEEAFPAKEPGLPQGERLRALLNRGVQMATALDHWHRLGLWVISRGEDRYPERLRRNLRSAAPTLLYGAGEITRLNQGGLAVVGSRNVAEEDLTFTRRVAERCVDAGIQVISGGARGVDQAAVAAALEAGGGGVAVLAERLDRTATSRDAKEPLRRGLLTLVTPYEPESTFTVGRAMGRNKHIYALADSALVVRFTTEEGGTWAGAIEHLGRNKQGSARVHVFVRVASNPADGCQELERRGALPFPEEAFFKGTVTEVLRQANPPSARAPDPSASAATVAAPATEENTARAEPCAGPEVKVPPAVVAAPGAPVETETDTCYRRCLPLLLQSLREEPGEKQLAEIAKRLEILPKQLKEWLKRAIEERKVVKKKKGQSFVYADVGVGEKQTLFDRGGDAA